MYQPGNRWLYNTSCDVLGVLIARVSGESFEAFLRERLFHPLGLKDTASTFRCRSPVYCRAFNSSTTKAKSSKCSTMRRTRVNIAALRHLNLAPAGWYRRSMTTTHSAE